MKKQILDPLVPSPVRRSIGELERAAAEAAENALILYATLPVAQIAERAVKEADADLLAELGQILLLQHFTKLVRAERLRSAKQSRQSEMLFPELEHLPSRIAIPGRRGLDLSDAHYTDLKKYLKLLNQRYRERQEGDPRILEVEKLLKVMEKYIRKNRGITVGEVAALEDDKL